MDTELTSHDICRMKIGISVAFAERYNLSYGQTARFFRDNGIYEYIDRCSDAFIFRTYPYMAGYIAREYGVPKNDFTR